MPLILHVTEAHHGGIATSIASFVDATPQYDHALLYSARRAPHRTDPDQSQFAATRLLEGGHVTHLLQIRKAVQELRPDLVHAHSSYAGLYTRLGAGPGVVYSPHCYSFELEVPAWRVSAYRLVEHLLARSSVGTIAVSPYEAERAVQLAGHRPVWLVPNAVETRSRPARPRTTGAPLRIGSIGRITAQKGIRFFLEVVRACADLKADWTWIGGGDPDLESELRAVGIRVTGWVGHDQALEKLADLDLYVHTANAEGSPMTFAEAAHLGVPVVARDIPHLRGIPLVGRSPSPEGLAELIRSTLAGDAHRNPDHPALQEMRALFSRGEQARHLDTAYREALLPPRPARQGRGR